VPNKQDMDDEIESISGSSSPVSSPGSSSLYQDADNAALVSKKSIDADTIKEVEEEHEHEANSAVVPESANPDSANSSSDSSSSESSDS
jgi:hypothetical protein